MENKVNGARMMQGENQEMREKLEFLNKKVEINDQLKNIDLEELKLIARSNLVMNNNITDLISKWENLNEKRSTR
jgi:predicted nuclease with TOPRIM domain